MPEEQLPEVQDQSGVQDQMEEASKNWQMDLQEFNKNGCLVNGD